MNFMPSPLDWSRERRSGGGGGGALDESRGSSKRSGGGNSATDDRGLDMSRGRTHEYIMQMASLVNDPIELNLDEMRLQNAVREAAENSLGVDAIAVWMIDEESCKLVQPPGGWWRSGEMKVDSSTRGVALARLEDKTRDDYVPPIPVSPGCDIAGILYTESRSGLPRRFSFYQEETSNIQPVRWRDIKSISADPDSAKGPRLQLMEEAGFTMAAGIPFRYLHHEGMVIFLTTVDDRNDEILTCIANGAYLHQAAQFIGAALSLAEIRRASLAERYKLEEKTYSIRRSPLSIEEGRGGDAKDSDIGQAQDNSEQKRHDASRHCHIPPQVIAWSRKLKGGSMQVPPSLSWRQTLWTIFGSFVGLLVLSSLNQYYLILSDEDYYLLIGPFGAMCTLMYGLSAAPASQPRNAILGQAVAGAVSLAFTYIPEHLLPVWVRAAVGPAFAIGTMVKLGLVHPPAGAHSVVYASGKYNFGFYALVVLSTALSVIPATIVNNMSRKRQYPTYWGISQTLSWVKKFLCFRGSSKQEMNHEEKTEVIKAEGSDGFDGSSSKRANKKVQPNRLVIHEEEDDDSVVMEVRRI